LRAPEEKARRVGTQLGERGVHKQKKPRGEGEEITEVSKSKGRAGEGFECGTRKKKRSSKTPFREPIDLP